jgi:hypothetical protein
MAEKKMKGDFDLTMNLETEMGKDLKKDWMKVVGCLR